MVPAVAGVPPRLHTPAMEPAPHPLLAALPRPGERAVRLRVTASAESALRRGHPWLAVEKITEVGHEGAAGDRAVVFDRKRRFLAVGLWDPHSPIRLRVLRAREQGPLDRALLGERLEQALARRAGLPATDTDGFRLVHGESDGLPGLVLDRYAATVVAKLYSHAWVPWLADLLPELLARQPAERVVLRLSRQLQALPGPLHGLSDGLTVVGEPPDGPLIYRENGLRFEVDPVRGQKTGTFLDQRDNRARVRELAPGRRVLNVCSYAGGFSVAAAAGGATEVLSVDLNRHALQAAERNMALNADRPAVVAARHEVLAGDAFEVLADLADAGRRFDLIVIDPPAFARRRAQVERALGAYARLAGLGLSLLEPGGTIVLASCSAPVTPQAFREAMLAAAVRAGRPLRDVVETGHAVDHPTDFAESRYLKGLFARA